MRRRNPIAKAVQHIRPKVLPDKRVKATESLLDGLAEWDEYDLSENINTKGDAHD